MEKLIDISKYPVANVLGILLQDKSTKKNIIWATDTYEGYGEEFTDKVQMNKGALLWRTDMVCPRIQKPQEAQAERTRKRAEVFTPAWLCNQMNNDCDEDWFGRTGVFNTENEDHSWDVTEGRVEFPQQKTWQHYVDSRRLEITCGEAPYLVSRYDVSTGESIDPPIRRIGMLDRKLRVVNENTDTYEEWLKWAIRAFEASYGFFIEPDVAQNNFVAFIQNHGVVSGKDADAVIPYKLREEQAEAVQKTAEYFKGREEAEFLWNAKPRFGKTLSAYHLCMELGAKNILIVTNRPAIANSWYQDYETYFGPQSGYLFVSNVDGIKDRKYVYSREEYLKKANANEDTKGCIEFVSLQDLKGSVYFGGRFDKLAEVSAEKGLTWDIMIVDEAHEGVDTYKTDTAFAHIRRKWTLHLSGTPFKALANDKFPESAIYNWTYADEQKKKRDWDATNELENPYATLPRLSLFTYQMSELVRDKVSRGIELAEGDVEEYAFDLNEFFRTNESGKFVHDTDVDKFLDALTTQEKFPFSTPELREELKRTFWILNRVASAKALAKKLSLHPVFKDYEVVLAAGDGRLDDDDENEKSFDKVTKAIAEHGKTITLSVGQLTTGVTIPEWTAVLMLSNMASPALYMQAAFRAQNPCLFTDAEGNSYRKQNAYVFDFDPARTLTIFEQFANDLIPETSGEKGDFDSRKQNVRELLNFFPVYGEDEEGSMIELDAEKVLTIPRHIHAREVVERGFMSNFLFANISGIFGAPKEIIDIINNMQAIEAPKALPPAGLDESTADSLNLNEDGEVEIPKAQIIGTASNLFGEKVYADVGEQLEAAVEDIQKNAEFSPNPKKDELKALREKFSKPFADTLMGTAKQQYGEELKKSTQNQLQP